MYLYLTLSRSIRANTLSPSSFLINAEGWMGFDLMRKVNNRPPHSEAQRRGSQAWPKALD
jgi:hypothetical protein